MKRVFWLLLLVGAVSLGGCTHEYVMTMTNGTRIVSASRPKLDKDSGKYMYKDARGDKHYVSQARVSEIAPASDVQEPKPKKK